MYARVRAARGVSCHPGRFDMYAWFRAACECLPRPCSGRSALSWLNVHPMLYHELSTAGLGMLHVFHAACDCACNAMPLQPLAALCPQDWKVTVCLRACSLWTRVQHVACTQPLVADLVTALSPGLCLYLPCLCECNGLMLRVHLYSICLHFAAGCGMLCPRLCISHTLTGKEVRF